MEQRPPDSRYPFVRLDAIDYKAIDYKAIDYKAKDHGPYQSQAVYTVLAVNLEGKQEILGRKRGCSLLAIGPD